MKREYFATVAVSFFILSYVLDFLGGAVALPIKNPFDLLQQRLFSTYPFTAVSVGFKTLASFIAILLFLKMIEQKYLAKGAFLIFLSAMMELYSIQQIATNSLNLPMVWIVAISYTGILLLLPAIINLFIGVAKKIHRGVTSLPYDEITHGIPPEDL